MNTEKYLWEILVPTHFNDGQEIPVSHHKMWDEKVLEITKGMTILKAAKGRWLGQISKLEDGNDTRYFETILPVRIACTEEEIKVIARLSVEHYEQVKILYYRIADKLCFYPYP